jgi:hypothetical protein
MSVLLFLLLSATTLTAWFGVFWIIPWCERSAARDRFWHLRDALYDSIRRDEFTNDVEPRKLLAEVELAIRYADKLTVFNLYLAQFTAGKRDLPKSERLDPSGVKPDDRDLFDGYRAAFYRGLSRLLLTGSVSGWIAGLFVVPSAVLVVVRHLRRGGGSLPELVKQQVGDNLEAEPKLAAVRTFRVRTDEPLSACVG